MNGVQNVRPGHINLTLQSEGGNKDDCYIALILQQSYKSRLNDLSLKGIIF